MSKAVKRFLCQECGASHLKWAGKCEACGSWNTLLEEVVQTVPKGMSKERSQGVNFFPLKGDVSNYKRYVSNNAEFDRVCGGGLVPGSVILVGGDPGIGKSTLLLQIMAALSKNIRVAYISGEEAIDQVRLRAKRLNVEDADVKLASSTNLRDILSTLESPDAAQVVIIDSIQTMYIDSIDSAPGTVSQVRSCSQELIRLAKMRDLVVILVGHVTKEGMIAGPKVLEHMVDTVLYFEGERGHQFRILRSVKNRFGATDEIGVFSMTDRGLLEVNNPSALFLSERTQDTAGSVVFAGVEGTRPILVEVQALIAPSSYASPRRSVVGWDLQRLNMILAVLEARCGIALGFKDIYLNIAGGLKIQEPAADLAVAAALLSAYSGANLDDDCVVFGEIGLSGEIRQVNLSDVRIKEASKLGFKSCIVPKQKSSKVDALKSCSIKHLRELLEFFDLSQVKEKQYDKRNNVV